MDYCIGFTTEDSKYRVYFINLSKKPLKVYQESLGMMGELDGEPLTTNVAKIGLGTVQPKSSVLIEESDIEGLEDRVIFSIYVEKGSKEYKHSFTLPSIYRAQNANLATLPVVNEEGLLLDFLS